MAVVKKVVWRMKLQYLRIDTFLFAGVLIDFFKFPLKRKLRVEKEFCLQVSLLQVSKLARADGASLNADSSIGETEMEMVLVLGVQVDLGQ